jgi:hypothetical protein
MCVLSGNVGYDDWLFRISWLAMLLVYAGYVGWICWLVMVAGRLKYLSSVTCYAGRL